ncbi:unnamed protein product [Alopecurus aequalis]
MARTSDEIVSDLVRYVLGPPPLATLSLRRPIRRLPRPAASHAAWRGLSESHLAEVFRYLPVPDLLRLGYLFTPNWREVWRRYPLYLHDRQFASLPIPRSEVANAITNVLEDFVGGEGVEPVLGSVHTFRVESTEWVLDHANRWCGALRRGKAVEVVLFNRGSSDRPSMIVNLPRRLLECTTVTILHLAFFTVRAGELDALTGITDLGLHGCACSNDVIERVVTACSNLEKLSVHDGAIGSVVVRSAHSLSCLSMLHTASRSLSVDDVPVLHDLLPGFAAALSIRRAPQLTGLLRLNLPGTTLKINGVKIAVGRWQMQPRAQMPSVFALRLALDYTALRRMGQHMVPRVVRQMLTRFPHLDRLIIERKDDVPREERMASLVDAHTLGHPDLFRYGLGGLYWRLHTLVLLDFRAGKAELDLLKALMKTTQKLWDVQLVYRASRHGIVHATARASEALRKFVLRSNNHRLREHPFLLRISYTLLCLHWYLWV